MNTPILFEEEHPEAAGRLMELYKEEGRLIRRVIHHLFGGKLYISSACIPRNDLCQCGSGKKYKKCCALIPRTKDLMEWSAHVTVWRGQACDLHFKSSR